MRKEGIIAVLAMWAIFATLFAIGYRIELVESRQELVNVLDQYADAKYAAEMGRESTKEANARAAMWLQKLNEQKRQARSGGSVWTPMAPLMPVSSK